MEEKKLSEDEALDKIKRILTGLDPESRIAKALRNIVNGTEPEAMPAGLDDDLRQVRIPDEILREWEMEELDKRGGAAHGQAD